MSDVYFYVRHFIFIKKMYMDFADSRVFGRELYRVSNRQHEQIDGAEYRMSNDFVHHQRSNDDNEPVRTRKDALA